MKRKVRIISLLFVMIGTVFLFSVPVKAAKLGFYNGLDNPAPGGKLPASACKEAQAFTYFCRVPSISGTRISFIYYDGSSYEMLGHSIDVYGQTTDFSNVRHRSQNINSKVATSSKLSLNDFKVDPSYEFTIISGLPTNGKNEGDYWEKKLITNSSDENKTVIFDSEVDQLAYQATGHRLSGSGDDFWSRKSEAADPNGGGIGKIGYRILIEPIRLYTGQDNHIYVMTPTEFASVVWNTPAKRTTTEQVQYYLGSTARMRTKVNDIGIYRPILPCGTKDSDLKTHQLCDAGTVQFSKTNTNGHALHIIDITDLIDNTCDFELLAKKKPEEYDEKDYKCCKEGLDEIENKYNESNSIAVPQIKCMTKANATVESLIVCFQNYYDKKIQASENASSKFDELQKFYETYPGCGDENCTTRFTEINDTWKECKEYYKLSDEFTSFITGSLTECQIKYTNDMIEWKKICDPDNEHDECPYTECPTYKCKVIPLSSGENIYYGKDGKEIDKETYDKECKTPETGKNICKVINNIYYGKDGNPTDKITWEKECDKDEKKYICSIIDGKYYGKNGQITTQTQYFVECDGSGLVCDYDDPNYFPSEQNPNNTGCCEQWEEETKLLGLTGSALREYVEKWFYEPGKEFRLNCLGCDINDARFTEACCKELMDKYPDYPDEFWVGKGCKSGGDTCTDKDYNVITPNGISLGDCTVATEVTMKDDANWDCVFKSDDIDDESSEDIQMYKDYYLKMSNPYCAVYCQEAVNYEFPDGKMIVKAGNHFTVNDAQKGIPDWQPVHFVSTRTCKAGHGSSSIEKKEGVDYSKFLDDWTKANDATRKAWDEYQIALTREKMTDHYEMKVSNKSGPAECGGRNNPGVVMEGPQNAVYNGEQVKIMEYCSSEDLNKIKDIYYRERLQAQLDFYRALANLEQIENDILACTNWEKFDNYAKWYPANNPEYDSDTTTVEDSIGILEDLVYSNAEIGPSLTDIKATRYNKYGSYEKFKEFPEFSPDLTIHYQDGKKQVYNYDGELAKQIITEIEKDNFVSSDLDRYDPNTITNENRANCRTPKVLYTVDGKCKTWESQECDEGESCPPVCVEHWPLNVYATCGSKSFTYSVQEKVEATYKKTVEYQLKENVYDVVIKPSGNAVSSDGLSLAENETAIYLGYSALHSHIMNPTGRYYIKLEYPEFTPAKGSGGLKHNFDQFFKTESKTYECSYQVHNEIIENKDPNCEGDNCDPLEGDDKYYPCKGENCKETTLKGLNLIYRPISLGDPFPGIEGEGRKFGSNWKGSSENEDEVIEKYIINNRELKSDKLYSEAYPMYQITLTPARIKEIRKYNDYEMKEDRGGYNDWNMDCSKATECKSDFIRTQLENGQDFSKYFREECTMSADRNKKSECCGVGNWNDCMEEDQSRNGGNI